MQRSLQGEWESYVVESQGLSGGLVVLWRRGGATVDALHRCSQQIVLVISEPNGRPWFFSGVYASTDYRVRRTLWDELSKLVSQNIPILVAGDFNCIQGPSEKRGGKEYSEKLERREFREFLGSTGLVDLGYSGPSFTWCNNRQGGARVWERLDRAVASGSWIQNFPDFQVSHLPRIASDHCPLLVCTSVGFQHQSPFRFEKIWLAYPQSWDVVREAWRTPVRGNAMQRVSRKLELTKRSLRRWNRDVVGDIFRRLAEEEAAIVALQGREVSGGPWSDTDLAELRERLGHHHSLLGQQEVFWRQKSRIQWLREGDRSTQFFHRSTILRRQRNRIRSIRDGSGQRVEDDQMIRQLLFDFFRSRWSEGGDRWIPHFAPAPELGVDAAENERLVAPVSEEEVRGAVWAMTEDKAPGPDGFPPLFFRRYWSVIRRDVVEAVLRFFDVASMPEDWMRTFITLVPKRQDAAEPSHFRPISLCTTLYKVVARIVMGRMKPLLPKLICVEQGAFIGGRNIGENVLVAQEIMWDLQRAPSRRSLMAVKLDMERAYDRVRWDFLRHALESFGFHERWITWVMGCVHMPQFSIIVNGTPSPFFHSSIGLRQGCPLSPYLFIICADMLSRSLRAACLGGSLEAYQPSPGARPISHLMYADDCLLVARATVKDASALKSILEEYCASSGQRINVAKSSICFSPKTSPRVKQAVRGCLGMAEKVGTWSYLGVPISGRPLRASDCTGVVDRIRERLEGWRARSLSMMGRVTLIRSVLCSIPTYLMASSVVPRSVLRSLEQLMRNFLWRGSSGGRGVHLVAWDLVCRPLAEGGLGLQSLVSRREILLARHAARFVLEPQGFWSQVMRARYGIRHTAGEPGEGRGCSFIWRAISGYLERVGGRSRWLIGDGRDVDVLDDSWVDPLPLRLWPTLVSVEVGEGMRVADLLLPDGLGWDPALVTRLFGGHLAERVLLVAVPGCGGPDVRVWGSTCSPRVRLRDLSELMQEDHVVARESGWIWRFGLHPRIALFLWKVIWGRLPTRVTLNRRGMSIPVACTDCGEEETVDHVLLHCGWAARVWALAGVPREALQSADTFTQAIRSWATAQPTRARAIGVTYLAYQIWGARNSRTFQGSCPSPRFILERAWTLAMEVVHVGPSGGPLTARDTWSSIFADAAPQMIFISWEPPPPSFLKVNFDGCVLDCGARGGVGFVIRGPNSSVVAAGGSQIFHTSVPGAELRAAWAGLHYARRLLGATAIVLEGDSTTVIGWIRGRPGTVQSHPPAP